MCGVHVCVWARSVSGVTLGYRVMAANNDRAAVECGHERTFSSCMTMPLLDILRAAPGGSLRVYVHVFGCGMLDVYVFTRVCTGTRFVWKAR